MYEFLLQLEPLSSYKLPPSKDVMFFVIADQTCYGEYEPDPHVIRLSKRKVGHLDTALKTMAHEMIHLTLYIKNDINWDKHGKSFKDLAYPVAETMGWDRLEF